VFLLGVPGNIFSMLVFTRPQLIKNPCSIYFFCAAITNLNGLFFGLFVRFLIDGFGIDPTSYNVGFCRFRYFILHASLSLSSWYIILAGIDRYCLSSRNVNRRRLSNLKYSRYLTAIITFIILAMYSQVLGTFIIEQQKSGPACYAPSGTNRI